MTNGNLLQLTGRITNIRSYGKVCFIDIFSQELIHLKLEENYLKDYHLIKDLQRGYLISVETDENTLDKLNNLLHLVKAIKILQKPKKFPKYYPKNIIKDKQIRYKNRILDLISNKDSFFALKNRFVILEEVRSFFKEKGAIEVDLPTLETKFGGALAEPFTTKCNYNSKDYFLRCSFEFPLKRLVIAGFPEIFYLGSAFRNESLDKTHSFEYLHFEYYTTSHEYTEVRKFVQELYCKIYHKIHKSYMDMDIDLRKDWPIYTKKDIELLLFEYQLQEIKQLMDLKLLGKYYFLEGLEQNPLAKNQKFNQAYVDYNMELSTQYQEENSSEKIIENIANLPDSAAILDDQFLDDLGYGLMETVGLGIGMDRLVQSILKMECIRDAQTFPFI